MATDVRGAAGWVSLVLLLQAMPQALADAMLPAVDDPALQRCAARNLPRETLVQTQHVTVVSDAGWVRKSRRRVSWKRLGERSVGTLIEVEAPPAEAGLKLLLRRDGDDEPELYVYTPDSGKARRMIGGGGSNTILGTDFTFEDARYFEGFLEPANTRRRSDDTLDGHPVYVIETRPDRDDSAYGRIVTRVDQTLCVPLETRFFAPNGERAKTLIVERSSVLHINGIDLPTRVTMHNHLARSRTEFIIRDIGIDVPLRDSLFSLASIRQGR